MNKVKISYCFELASRIYRNMALDYFIKHQKELAKNTRVKNF
jgi:hypothetical protein